MMEKYPGIYDGGISFCGPVAGGPELWDQSLVFALAYDVAFGWPETWGSVEDVRDDLDFWSPEVAPLVYSQLYDPSNRGKWEFLRMVSGLPLLGFYDPLPPFFVEYGIMRMWQSVGMRAEAEARAGGPVAENFDHGEYTLTQQQIDIINGLLTPPDSAESLLVEMNSRRNITAPQSARNYMGHWYNPSGRLRQPVLTVHTTQDPSVPVSHERAYRDVVEAAGNEDLLLQVYTDGFGHCVFTPAQILRTLDAIEHWLDTGVRPEESFFDPAIGFVHGFEPPPWPY